MNPKLQKKEDIRSKLLYHKIMVCLVVDLRIAIARICDKARTMERHADEEYADGSK